MIVLAVGLICRGLVLGTTKSKRSRLFCLFCKHPGLFVSIHCCCMSSERSLKYMLNVLSRALFCFAKKFLAWLSEALSSASGSDSATTTAFFAAFAPTVVASPREVFAWVPSLRRCVQANATMTNVVHTAKAVTVHCTTSIQDNMNIFTAELARDLNRSAKTFMYSAQKMHPKFIAHSVAPPAHRHHRDSSPWQRIRAYSYHRSTNCPRSLWHRLCGNDGDVRTHHRGNGSECHQYLAVSHRTIHTGCGAPGIQLTHIGRQNIMGAPGS